MTKKKDAGWVKAFVTDPEKIAKHKFVPLLHRTISQRKFRPAAGAPKNESGKRQRSAGEPKKRDIFYSSHLDSIIYGYYSHKLTIAYEEFLKNKCNISAARLHDFN